MLRFNDIFLVIINLVELNWFYISLIDDDINLFGNTRVCKLLILKTIFEFCYFVNSRIFFLINLTIICFNKLIN